MSLLILLKQCSNDRNCKVVVPPGFFFTLKGHHHKRNIKPVSAVSQHFIGFAWMNCQRLASHVTVESVQDIMALYSTALHCMTLLTFQRTPALVLGVEPPYGTRLHGTVLLRYWAGSQWAVILGTQ